MSNAADPHSRAADAVHEGRPIEAQYVRQGRRGTHVVRILLISLALVVVAFLAVWGLHMGPFASTENDLKAQPAEAAQFNASNEPSVRQNSAAPGEAPATD